MPSFWRAARLMTRREAFATHCLGLAGFETYLPRLRERRIIRGRRVEVKPPLFPGYCFVLIVLQWHAARWRPGVFNLIMDGTGPAKVPDDVIAEIRARERDGLIELPKPPALQRGDRVRIIAGPFSEHLALYAGQTAHERVAVLLRVLGGQQRVELPAGAIEAVEGCHELARRRAQLLLRGARATHA
jgi:transcriptional antiterminator RfaH